jgi:hypothetical protein
MIGHKFAILYAPKAAETLSVAGVVAMGTF